MENFRTPNFELVADCLYWLVKRYDPEINITDNIETEDCRVDFLMSAAQALLTKAKIKLNAKWLYAADGHAVKELLKVATMLYNASQIQAQSTTEDEDEGSLAINSRLKDIKGARTLATDITDRGARLYDLLGKEKDVKQERTKALRFLDAISNNLESTAEHQHIEKSIRDLISAVSDNIESMKRQCEDLEADEKNLDLKIKKKQSELERHEKRLKSLQTVRPAFMDEYEKLEKELQKQYDVYLERFRNLDYLEHELDLYNKSEKEKLEENDRSLKRMQKRLRDEELRILRGEQDVTERTVDDALGSENYNARKGGDNYPERSSGGRSKQSGGTGGGRARSREGNSRRREGDREGSNVQGSMTGGMSDESESEDISDDDISHDSDSEDSDAVSLAASSMSDEIEDDEDESEMSDGEDDGYDYASGESDENF